MTAPNAPLLIWRPPPNDRPGPIIRRHWSPPDGDWQPVGIVADKVVARIAAKRRAEAA